MNQSYLSTCKLTTAAIGGEPIADLARLTAAAKRFGSCAVSADDGAVQLGKRLGIIRLSRGPVAGTKLVKLARGRK